MPSALEALEWMKEKAATSYNDRILFRGQNRVWPTVKASITRHDEKTQNHVMAICRRFYPLCTNQGLTDVSANEHDRLALLQHYIGRSPVIDLTATPEIALYFALQGAKPANACVVYAISQNKASTPDLVLSDHSILKPSWRSGETLPRWLRQDAYSIGPRRWRELDIVKTFDLLALSGLEKMYFTFDPSDYHLIRHLGDLEETHTDPLASSVRSIYSSIARSLELYTDEIDKDLQRSKTRDPDVGLKAEIDDLVSLALRASASPELVDNIKSLHNCIEIWDTSFDCALDEARKQVRNLDTDNPNQKNK